MDRRSKRLYIFHCVCLTIEVLLSALCLFALLFGASGTVEWIVLLIFSIVEIPASLRTLRKYCNNWGQGDGSAVPSDEDAQT